MDETGIVSHEIPPSHPIPKEIRREVAFYRLQMVGVPLLLLLPIASLMGLLDTRMAATATSQGDVAISVQYPTRFRYRMAEPLVVRIENRGSSAIEKLTLGLSKAYVDRFSETTFEPEPDQVTQEAFEFELEDIEPGDSREVHLDMKSEDVGQAEGWVIAEQGGDSTRVDFSTFVLP